MIRHKYVRDRASWVFGVIVYVLVATASAEGSSDDRLILAGATLIDGLSPVPIESSRLIIANGRFECISGPDGCPGLAGDALIDVSGLWITPGLVDSHVHLDWLTDYEATLTAQELRFALGVTTVRDAGTEQLEALLEERRRAEGHELPVPRIVVSARPLEEYARRYGVLPGRDLVRHLVKLGVDGIKVKDHVSSDLFEDEIRAAVELDVPVWGHLLQSMGPPPQSKTDVAVSAGLNGATHLSWIAPFCQKPGSTVTGQPDGMDVHKWSKSYWLTTDPGCLDTLIAGIVENGVWLEPTLVTEWYWWRLELEPPAHLNFLRTRPPSLRDMITGHDALAERRPATFPKPYERMSDFVRRFHQAGGMLIAGTDDVRPGLDLHTEMQFMRDAGLSPFQSLQTATHNSAIALGRGDIGTIKVGKLADAVVYGSDPLDPDGTTLNVRSVIKGGVVFESDRLLEKFRRQYKEAVAQLWFDRVVRFLPYLLLITIVIALLYFLTARVFRLKH